MLIDAKKTESASALTVQVIWVGVRDLPEGAGSLEVAKLRNRSMERDVRLIIER
jgi:hypothetical protein